MYVQLTRYEVLSDKTDQAVGERISARVVSLPGVKMYTNLEDGVRGISIITYGKKTDAEAAVTQLQEMWQELDDLLAAPPVTEEYNVSTYVTGDAIRLLNEPARRLCPKPAVPMGSSITTT